MKRVKKPHAGSTLKFYESGPVIPADKLADKAPMQNASLGNEEPKMIPKSPGYSKGFGSGIGHTFRPQGPQSHGFGHAEQQRVGATRLSGHIHAHRIGKK